MHQPWTEVAHILALNNKLEIRTVASGSGKLYRILKIFCSGFSGHGGAHIKQGFFSDVIAHGVSCKISKRKNISPETNNKPHVPHCQLVYNMNMWTISGNKCATYMHHMRFDSSLDIQDSHVIYGLSSVHLQICTLYIGRAIKL